MAARARPFVAAAAVLAVAAGCVPGAGDRRAAQDRPAAKPAEIATQIVDRAGPTARLTRARVSTKSGDILILEHDGSVTTAALDSPSGQNAFDMSEADLAALNVNLGLNLSPADPRMGGLLGAADGAAPTAQELALAAFAARTQPALPARAAAVKLAPELFRGAAVRPLTGRASGDLVEVTAKLQPGVDADTAFAYATCALAGWTNGTPTPYARHIRTLQTAQGPDVSVGAIYILSATQPMGLRVMETNETLRECKERGIPAAQGGTTKHG